MRHSIAIALASLAALLPLRGIAAGQADDILARIDSRMAALDSLIFQAPALQPAPNVLAQSIEYVADTAYSQAVGAVADAQVGSIKAQTGIQLTGQTYYRLDGAVGLDDEDEAVSRYVGKIQAEARWYFLQSSLLKRKGRIEEIRLKADLDRLQHEDGRADPAIYASRERLRAISDSVLASVMLHRVDNLDLLEEAYIYLLGNENISSDRLLSILDDRAEAERKLATIATEPVRSPGLASVAATLVEIDTAAVLASLASTDLSLQIIEAKAKLIDKQADNITWWSDVRLAPFVRYSHYFRHAMPASQNVDAGISFTIPVNAEASRQRRAKRAEKELLDCQRDDMLARAADRVRYLARENERLNRAIAGEWQRAASLREYIKTRRNAYDHRAGEYNRLNAMMEYNSYIRCLESIVEMQYRRDCVLADLQAIVPAVPVLGCCTVAELK